MKYRVMSTDYETKTKPVEIWTEIKAADELQAALFFAQSIMNGPEDGEEMEIWVQSDKLYKFNVWAEVKFNIDQLSSNS